MLFCFENSVFCLGSLWKEEMFDQYFNGNIKLFQCPWCPYRNPVKFRMQRHVLKHTGERRFECGVCGRRFARKDNLKQHVTTHL